jgi:hypothetical protein
MRILAKPLGRQGHQLQSASIVLYFICASRLFGGDAGQEGTDAKEDVRYNDRSSSF